MVLDSAKENRGNNVGRQEQRPTFKTVIRRLPPTMTSSEFKSAIDPIPEHNYFDFEDADPSLGAYSFSRAYINFLKLEDLLLFRDKFDGYIFVDSKGNEFPAIVEFAPSQKIPKSKITATDENIRRDPKAGTIEEDPEYLEFLNALNESKNQANLPSAEIYLEEMEKRAKELKENGGCPNVVTPLMEYVIEKLTNKGRVHDERKRRERKNVKRNDATKGPKSKDGKLDENKKKKPRGGKNFKDKQNEPSNEAEIEVKKISLLKKEVKSSPDVKVFVNKTRSTDREIPDGESKTKTPRQRPPRERKPKTQRSDGKPKQGFNDKSNNESPPKDHSTKQHEPANPSPRRTESTSDTKKPLDKVNKRPQRPSPEGKNPEGGQEPKAIRERPPRNPPANRTSEGDGGGPSRTRNKDRPDIPRYQPKVRTTSQSETSKQEGSRHEGKPTRPEERPGGSSDKPKVNKTRVFTRSKK